MQDTGFSLPAEKLERLATCYQTDAERGGLTLFEPARGGDWSRPPAFPSARGGLVSTVDDYLAFGQLLLNGGRHGRERFLSRASVETMTTDQLTPEQRASAGFFLENRGWGFGLSVVIRRTEPAAAPGRFGWDGGYGTSWYSDPSEDLVAILMAQRLWDAPEARSVYLDFWTSVYQAIDD
jgi:CubicO group peptidase (beta-lactamase class C family)